MLIKSKAWLLPVTAGLLLGLQVTSSNGLHCFKCRGCNHLNWAIDQVFRCIEGEVCSKDVMFYPKNGTTVTLERAVVSRNCKKYDPARDILNGCQQIKGVSPPYPGIRCMCNDTEYCNGAVVSCRVLDVQLQLLFMITFQIILVY
ncbi:unnamed protein product [Orchesella dallaii]|uniref:Protein quiver n=1 Tax=Orchesella dallaii TaxID=48710 RepID=A0ABP1Q710_9HEXA